MNPETLRKLERQLRKLDRRRPRAIGRGFTAALVFAAGLMLAHFLLSRLVFTIWETLLPGGLDQADSFVGWPGLVWHAAVFCRVNYLGTAIAMGVAALVAFIATSWGRLFRVALWLAAVSVLILNAGILVIVLRSSMHANAAAAGLRLP